MLAYPPIPNRIPIADVKTGMANEEWVRWLRGLAEFLCAEILGFLSADAQEASLPQAAVNTPVLSRGTYRISYYVQVTRPATTSSSLELEIHWTAGGVAQVFTTGALTGNTTTTLAQGSTIIEVDEGTTIDREVTYASVGGTTMQYSVRVLVEAIRA